MEVILGLLPATGAIAGSVLAIFLFQKFMERGAATAQASHQFRNQLLLVGLISSSILLVIMTLPLGDTLRGQILSFLAIVLSAGIALSSTTILGNMLAGLMLRIVQSFRMGDFIKTGEHFGRVSERGLFHTEIQTVDRDLTTLPNLYLVTHPVTTLRTSGTIVSATVSLGYDVPRSQIEEALLEAAARTELTDPFVQIQDLGDFSVTYRIGGLLNEVKRVLSTRSNLRGQVLDVLHQKGVEIVSPNFMNTRALPEEKLFIPKADRRMVARKEDRQGLESIVFDKAEKAESLETLKQTLATVRESLEALEKTLKDSEDGPQHEKLSGDLEKLQRQKKRLEKIIEARSEAE